MSQTVSTHPSVRSMTKRLIDLTSAVLGLILLAPLFGAVALAVFVSVGTPILFRQVRHGYQARPFTIYKFRTMREAYGTDGAPLSDADRLTGLGRLLRKTSLDEIPQLWNVLRGELSLVGPRPQLSHYLSFYTREQEGRHEVRPGITGWAQIHGRNAIGWEQKFQYDAWYINHWSLWLDSKILFLTVFKVIQCEGTEAPPSFKPFHSTVGSKLD